MPGAKREPAGLSPAGSLGSAFQAIAGGEAVLALSLIAGKFSGMEAIIGIIGAIIGAVIAVLVERWLTKGERQRAKEAEEELKQIKRRSAAPFLTASDAAFNGLHFPGEEPGKIGFCPAGSGAVLCFMRDEVGEDLETGDPVFFVIENHGSPARSVKLILDGKPIRLQQEPDFESSNELQFLRYEFDREKFGKSQRLELTFEADSGLQDSHVYELLHGVRSLKRIDPPLP